MNDPVSQAIPVEAEQHDPLQEAAPAAAPTEADVQALAEPEAAGSGEPKEPEGQAVEAAAQAAQEGAQEDPQEQLTALTRQAAAAELRAAAALAGVPAERLDYVVRLCDRDALCVQGADMSALAAGQVAGVLRDVPELGGARSMPGSLGDHKHTGTPGKSAEELAREAFAAQL